MLLKIHHILRLLSLTRQDILENFGVSAYNYIVAVGRFVPEKGFHDLIHAYKAIDTDIKLVLVGDADHESDYSTKLKKLAKENNVVLTGFQSGIDLRSIFGNARLFVLPSYHEGLPIALLEAMAFGLNVLVSDIPANKMVNLNSEEYFKLGDINDLQEKITYKLNRQEFKDYRHLIEEKYNWDKIAKETLMLYGDLNN